MLATKLQKTNNYYITRHSSSDTEERTTKNSTSTLLVSLHVRNRTAESGGRDRVITCMFCRNLHKILTFFGLSQKDLFKGR